MIPINFLDCLSELVQAVYDKTVGLKTSDDTGEVAAEKEVVKGVDCETKV